ncbi:MAG: DUF1579 domain-containing protein [Ignavibacteria bacterium]
MKLITKFLFAALFITSYSTLFAQTEAEQKAWMDYMTPSPVHEMLAKSNGDWIGDVTVWMTPDSPPVKATSTTTNKMIMGGRYQSSTHTGNMMGMPFEGMSLIAYDNAKKVFKSTWIDNMGTGMMNMEGTWDGANTINMKGTMVDPMTGNDRDVRETFKLIDDNNQVLEMFEMRDGKEVKTMEIAYTRK